MRGRDSSSSPSPTAFGSGIFIWASNCVAPAKSGAKFEFLSPSIHTARSWSSPAARRTFTSRPEALDPVRRLRRKLEAPYRPNIESTNGLSIDQPSSLLQRLQVDVMTLPPITSGGTCSAVIEPFDRQMGHCSKNMLGGDGSSTYRSKRSSTTTDASSGLRSPGDVSERYGLPERSTDAQLVRCQV